jgi:hypothetical protein
MLNRRALDMDPVAAPLTFEALTCTEEVTSDGMPRCLECLSGGV